MALVHRKTWWDRNFDFAGSFAVAFLFRTARAGPLEDHAAWSYDSCPTHSTVLQYQHMSHRGEAMGYARNSTFKKRYLLFWRIGREMPPAFRPSSGPGWRSANSRVAPIHIRPLPLAFVFEAWSYTSRVSQLRSTCRPARI